MKTSLSSADLHESVISVPPLCRDAQLRPSAGENAKLIGHIEAGAAPQHARHALLEQQPLDELAFRLVASAYDPDQLSLRQLGLDFAGPLLALGHLLVVLAAHYQRDPARGAKAFRCRVFQSAARADERCHSTTSSASRTWPSLIAKARTSGGSEARPTIT